MRARKPNAPPGNGRVISSRRLYVGLVILLMCLSALELALRRLPLLEPEVALADSEKAQLEIFKENSQLITTLATAVLGATAGILLKRDKTAELPSSEKGRIIFSITCAALSMYFGHVASGQVLFMLHAKFFNMYYPGIWLSSQLQFGAFMCSIIALADATYRMVLRSEVER